MAAAAVSSNPRTVEEIFKDYSARRAALLRALTKGLNPLSLSFSKFPRFLRNAFGFVL